MRQGLRDEVTAFGSIEIEPRQREAIAALLFPKQALTFKFVAKGFHGRLKRQDGA